MAEAGCLRDVAVQNLEVNGNATVTGTVKGGKETDYPTAAYTAIVAAGALARNSFNTVNVNGAGANVALTLPAQNTCVKGDTIHIVLIGDIDDNFLLKIGTAGELFTAGSRLITRGTGDRATTVDFADGANDAFLDIAGVTNGDGGIGTTVDLYFNGSTWSVNAFVEGQGAMNVAATSVFS